jgi:hypothetical protein
MYAGLSFAVRGSTFYFKIILLPISGTLASGLVLTPATMFVQFIFNLVWKWLVSMREPGPALACTHVV